MKIKNYHLTLSFAMMLIFLTISTSCKKDNDSDDDNTNDEVTISPRQVHAFSVPNVGFSKSCPTLVNDYLYIGTSSPANVNYPALPQNYFYKLDLSLNKIWEYSLGNKQLRGSASLDSYGNIYFVVDSVIQPGSVTPTLYSLDNNGNFRWSKHIGGGQWGGLCSVAISEDNIIYAGGDSFSAFDINGNVKWTYTDYMPGEMKSSPIIDPDGNIYFGAMWRVYSLDTNGNLRWKFTSTANLDLEEGVSSPAFSKDYSHIIMPIGTNIYCIESSTGNLTWEYDFVINADFRDTPAVDDNDNIYIGSHGDGNEKDESTLYAIKADGSGLLWQVNLGSDMYSSPTLGDDRVIYIGSEGYGNTDDVHNRFHAFNMTDGTRMWSAQLHNDVGWGSPIISDAGIVYVATAYIDGTNGPSGIYGFQTDATGLLQNCGSPTYHMSNAHTGRR